MHVQGLQHQADVEVPVPPVLEPLVPRPVLEVPREQGAAPFELEKAEAANRVEDAASGAVEELCANGDPPRLLGRDSSRSHATHDELSVIRRQLSPVWGDGPDLVAVETS